MPHSDRVHRPRDDGQPYADDHTDQQRRRPVAEHHHSPATPLGTLGRSRRSPGRPALGALLLTLVTFGQLMIWDSVDEDTLTGAHRAFMGRCYVPMLLWGPLLAAVTVSYHLRRRRER
ncbi:hypothetical protein RB201_16610 [Streptomyces sp. S1A(2023)]